MGWLSERQIQLRIDAETSQFINTEAHPIAPRINPRNIGDINTIFTPVKNYQDDHYATTIPAKD